MCSGVVLNEDVKWVTFHSSYDFGYLLKVLTQQQLPETESEFLQELDVYFPNIYDIKYMIKFCDTLHGGLNYLAKLLNVQRVGPQHQAGSDSLLTSSTFVKLLQTYFVINDEGDLQKYCGKIYGLGEDGKTKFSEKHIQANNYSGYGSNAANIESHRSSTSNQGQTIDQYSNGNQPHFLTVKT